MIGNVLQKVQVLTALLKNILNALNVLKKEWINGTQKKKIVPVGITVVRIIMDFPDWYTIDSLVLDSLNYFLKKNYKDKTILIEIKEVEKKDEK